MTGELALAERAGEKTALVFMAFDLDEKGAGELGLGEDDGGGSPFFFERLDKPFCNSKVHGI